MLGSASGPCAESRGALQPDPADMSLRICGTQYDGQVVRLPFEKCSIGSGVGCTLRLVAAGVAPLHCLILRGPGGMIVRGWSPNTRLNGLPITDAELRMGDRLAVGPIELEVLGETPRGDPESCAEGDEGDLPQSFRDYDIHNGRANDPAGHVREARRLGRQRVGRLAMQLRAAREQQSETEARLSDRVHETEQLQTRLQQFASELAQLRGEHAALTNAGQHAADEIQRLAGTVEQLTQQLASEQLRFRHERQQWDTARQQWDHERQQLEQQVEHWQGQWESQQTAVGSSTSQLGQEREQWEAERKCLENQLAEATRAAQRHDDTQRRLAALETEATAARREADDLRTRLADLEREYGLYVARFSTREIDLRKAESLLDQRARQLDEATVRLNQQREEFAAQRAQWEQQRRHQEQELDDAGKTLPDEYESVNVQPQWSTGVPSGDDGDDSAPCLPPEPKGDAEFDPIIPSRVTPEAEVPTGEGIDQPSSTLSLRSETAEDHDAAVAQGHTIRLSPGQWSAPPKAPPVMSNMHDSDQIVPADAADPPAQVQFQPAAEEAPQRAADVLARLGRTHVLRPDDDGSTASTADGAGEPLPADSAGDVEQTLDAARHAFTRRARSPGKADDDESIEAYMARLLKRVRGEDTGNASLAPAVVHRSHPTAADNSSFDGRPELKAPTAHDHTRFSPRRLAPEAGSNLAAMRQLAKESARVAIQTSDQRRNQTVVRDTLLMAGVAAMLGLVFVVLSVVGLGGTLVLLLGSLVSFIAATVLSVQAHRHHRKQEHVAPDPDLERNSPPAEEPASRS